MIMCDLEFEMHYCEFWWISDTNFGEFDFVKWKFVMRMCVILILCDFGFVMWIYDGFLWELVRWICGWRIFVNLWYEFVRMCGENLSEFLCWRFIILWWRWVITICDEFMFYEFVWISKMDMCDAFMMKCVLNLNVYNLCWIDVINWWFWMCVKRICDELVWICDTKLVKGIYDFEFEW